MFYLLWLHSPNILQRIPSKVRPEEIAWWIKRHKQASSVPKVKVAEFATEWYGWWRAMQPAWRRVDEEQSLSRNIPSTEEWDTLARGGSNGLFLVVMALSWWLQGFTSTEPTDEFWSAVSDVVWVLEAITNVLASPSVEKKRQGEEIVSGGPSSKRYVLLTISNGHIYLFIALSLQGSLCIKSYWFARSIYTCRNYNTVNSNEIVNHNACR